MPSSAVGPRLRPPAVKEVLSQRSKYHFSSYLVAIWAPKVHTILVLGPFGVFGLQLEGLEGLGL